MSVFPNPFDNGFDIQFTAIYAGNYAISITDQAGKLIYETDAVLTSGDNLIHLSTNNMLTSGVYNLVIMFEENGIYMTRVVKVD